MKRISDEKIRVVTDVPINKWHMATYNKVAQAQLEANQKEVQELFDEIERNFEEDIADGRTSQIRIRYQDWQDFKRKWVVKLLDPAGNECGTDNCPDWLPTDELK